MILHDSICIFIPWSWCERQIWTFWIACWARVRWYRYRVGGTLGTPEICPRINVILEIDNHTWPHWEKPKNSNKITLKCIYLHKSYNSTTNNCYHLPYGEYSQHQLYRRCWPSVCKVVEGSRTCRRFHPWSWTSTASLSTPGCCGTSTRIRCDSL